jgi:hypothetical protein
MSSIRKDIKITLLIKFTLLFLLWWICFKGVKKPDITEEWLLKTPISTSNKHKGEL